MYFTGIDVHSNQSTLQHMTEDGYLGVDLELKTREECFNEFFSQFDQQSIVVLEAGRHHWWLNNILEQHPNISEVKVVDARRSRKIAEELSVQRGYGRAKNDRIDAEMLAELARQDLAPEIHVLTLEQLAPRSIVRHRSRLLVQHTRAINTLHGLLGMHGVILNTKDFFEQYAAKADAVKTLPPYCLIIIDDLLSQIQLYDTQIGTIEAELDTLLPPDHPQIKLLMTAPGIGIVLARIIYTEIRDIRFFKEPKYLISYSGLAPFDQESNGKKGTIKLNRYSNHWLKYAFVEAAHHARTHEKYKHKYEADVKKHGKIRAKLNLARRLTKAVYWMLTRQQPFV